MKKTALVFFSFVSVLAFVLQFSSCRRINEATDLGGGVIPPVDGINTFDTLISVQTFHDTFGIVTDSQYVSKGEVYYLGRINNDPFFGQTDARMFLELKPVFFPWYFRNNKPDSLYIDSVVLVLGYLETYGDTLAPQTVNVYEMAQGNNFRSDTSYLIRKDPFVYNTVLGTRTFSPRVLDDSIKVFQDTTSRQLRIRLDNSFGQRLLSYDSIRNTVNGGYAGDSAFRSKFKGFALRSMGGGNAVMGFDLGSNNTKLAIYYRYDKNGKRDTTVDYFRFTSTFCAAANAVLRNYSGTPVEANVGGTAQDPLLFIQNTPGTFAMVKVPDLMTISNRLIHRAELVVEQVYDISDSLFTPPEFLYLDAADPSITTPYKFRTIPYDVGIQTGGGLNLLPFGIRPTTVTDATGNKIKVWKFNITRYVQNVLTRRQSLYDLRLFSPFSLNEKYGVPPGPDVNVTVFVNSTTTRGRLRVGGGNHPTQRMRLRLVYSKL